MYLVEQDSSKQNTKRKQKSKPEIKQEIIKIKPNAKKGTILVTHSQKPGPSAYYISSDGEIGSLFETDEESKPCSVCGKNSPPDFRQMYRSCDGKVGSVRYMWPLDSSPFLYRHSCHQTEL